MINIKSRGEKQRGYDALNASLVGVGPGRTDAPTEGLNIFCFGPVANSRFPSERRPRQSTSGVPHGDITMYAHTHAIGNSIGNGNSAHEFTDRPSNQSDSHVNYNDNDNDNDNDNNHNTPTTHPLLKLAYFIKSINGSLGWSA